MTDPTPQWDYSKRAMTQLVWTAAAVGLVVGFFLAAVLV